ncbi:MAG TPA: zinc-binding alcohol dehydrogenase family protein [Longimicrobium sp.]|nr:zinc-binding alcohol dehydrogenase family protein [Longimicrobium sp.]
MNNLVVFGGHSAVPGATPIPHVRIDGAVVGCGVVPAAEPAFRAASPDDGGRVLVEVRAFSCNYRDKTFCRAISALDAGRFSTVGSEFMGVVREVGHAVSTLRPGDRVITNQHYEGVTRGADGVRHGVVSNQASRRWHVLPEQKLRRIPDRMSDEVGGGFGLNAQTAYSMIRRAGLAPGARVLVTSATSNTSLALIGGLLARGLEVYAATTSPGWVPRLRETGVRDVLAAPRAEGGFRCGDAADRFARAVGGFDCVMDPFFDLHLEKALQLMNPFGTYVTCGLFGQNPDAARDSGTDAPMDVRPVLQSAIARNLSIVGNCIGLAGDLDQAIADFESGALRPLVDRSYGGDDAAGFLERTYNDPQRFGKVVFHYA